MDPEVQPMTESLIYNSIKEKPECLIKLVDKWVKLQLIKNTSFEGFILSIDPISHSIILAVPTESSFQAILIPGHAILEVTESTTSIKPPSKCQAPSESDEDASARRTRLISWLKCNLLPVTESGDNVIVGSVNVLPPYKSRNIYAENTVVALQIRKLIENMPNDFDPVKPSDFEES